MQLINFAYRQLCGLEEFRLNLVAIILRALYYLMFCSVALVMDSVVIIFRKFCGLETVYYGNNLVDGDIVLSLVQDSAVMDIFWKVLVVAIILLLITTFIATIKSEFADFSTQTSAKADWQNNKMRVFYRLARGIINIFGVPIICFVGIVFANALLRTLDKATSSGDNVKFSSRIFVACASGANRAFKDDNFYNRIMQIDSDYSDVYKFAAEDKFELADEIDSLFLKGKLATEFSIHKVAGMEYLGDVFQEDGYTEFSVYKADLVFYYYDLSGFNFLMAFATILIVTTMLSFTLIGIIKRLYSLTIFFIISPLICALAPIDNTNTLKAMKSWRKAFVGTLLSAYASVVSINLYITLIDPLCNIRLFSAANDFGGTGVMANVMSVMGADIFNKIAQLFIIVSGAIFIQKASESISKMIGSEDAMGIGAKFVKNIIEKVVKLGSYAMMLIPAGGAAIAAAQLVAKEGIKQAAKMALKKAKEGIKNKVLGGGKKTGLGGKPKGGLAGGGKNKNSGSGKNNTPTVNHLGNSQNQIQENQEDIGDEHEK